ncbi:ATP-binding protein [Endothiovibrio diazotrophicus]
MKPDFRSIRIRLLLVLLSLFTAASLALIASIHWKTSHEAEEIYDAHLARVGHLLLGLAVHEVKEREKEQAQERERDGGTERDRFNYEEEVEELERLFPRQEYAARPIFQIWRHGRLLMRSSRAPREPLTTRLGLSNHDVEGAPWRIFEEREPERGVEVMVAEKTTVREEMIHEISMQSVYPALIALPLLALLIWVAVGRGLRPLARVAEEVATRSPKWLEPVPLDRHIPSEVVPLVGRINGLLERLGSALERERRFTADASHELRTPLAIVKTQAQVARRATDKETCSHALNQILAGVDRTTHLVEQLLTIARLDPDGDSQGMAMESIALDALAAEAVADGTPLALEKEIELGLSNDPQRQVTAVANGGALKILLRNLIDNAVRYTPTGGEVEVAVEPLQGGGARLRVDDSGPGVPAEARGRLFERFHRGNRTDSYGCGLGLSIVQRIVELHRAAITLEDSPLGGLRVSVEFRSRADG